MAKDDYPYGYKLHEYERINDLDADKNWGLLLRGGYEELTSAILNHPCWYSGGPIKGSYLNGTQKMEYYLLYTIMVLAKPDITRVRQCYDYEEECDTAFIEGRKTPDVDLSCSENWKYIISQEEIHRISCIVKWIKERYREGCDIIMEEFKRPQSPFFYIPLDADESYAHYWKILFCSPGKRRSGFIEKTWDIRYEPGTARKNIEKDEKEKSYCENFIREATSHTHMEYLEIINEKIKKYENKKNNKTQEIGSQGRNEKYKRSKCSEGKYKKRIISNLDLEKYDRFRFGYDALAHAVIYQCLPDDPNEAGSVEVRKMEYCLLYTIIALCRPEMYRADHARKDLKKYLRLFDTRKEQIFIPHEEAERIIDITQWLIEKYRNGSDIIMRELRRSVDPFFYIDDEIDQLYTFFWKSLYCPSFDKGRQENEKRNERKWFSQLEYLERVHKKLMKYTQKAIKRNNGAKKKSQREWPPWENTIEQRKQ